MTLRDQILAAPEMLSDLEWAAEQRFLEGGELLGSRRFSGAIYLLGLAAEMWLKVCVFRFRGATSATPINGLLGPARAWMRVHAPTIDAESYHSLLFWAEFLILARSTAAAQLDSATVGDLRHHVVNRLYEDWRIDIRYRVMTVGEQHARRVYQDVSWLRQNRQMLWR